VRGATLTTPASKPMAHHTLLVIPAKAGIEDPSELANVPYRPTEYRTPVLASPNRDCLSEDVL
jgi:hypothetical protein